MQYIVWVVIFEGFKFLLISWVFVSTKKIIHKKFNFYTDTHTTSYATEVWTHKFVSFTIHENLNPRN